MALSHAYRSKDIVAVSYWVNYTYRKVKYMIQWYSNPWSEVVKKLGSNIYAGLDEEQVRPLREQYGGNKIYIPKTKSLSKLILRQMKELWIIAIIVSILIFLYLKQFVFAGMELTILLINVLCIAFSEYNEEKSIKELEKLNSGYARVVRDGRTLKIPSEQLVMGDIVIVGKGEGVPADLRVIEGEELRARESSITGEDFIAEKYETKIEGKELALSDMKNILFKSSIVVGGSGTGIVIATGMNTQIANIVRLLFEEKNEMFYFNKRLHKILNYCSAFVILCIIINIFAQIASKENINYIVRTVTLLVSITIPQSIVFIISIVSAIIFRQMKKESIVFKNLSTIEKFSSISALCTDKVGAFSKEKFKAVKIYTSGVIIETSGGQLIDSTDEDKNQNLYRILSIGLLCNDVKTNIGNSANIKNDLMETALVQLGIENGIDKRKLEREHRRILNIAFDSERRMMTTINVIDENYRASVKGVVDSLLNRCTHIMRNGVETEITDEDINAIRKADISMSIQCLSVIGLAYRNFSYEPSLKENIESNLVFVGLVGFENMLNDEAIESVKKSKILSVKPIIITEDNKLTALAIGKKLGVTSKLREVLSGIEIDNMADEEFERIGDKVGIFSKINSKHKVKIIKALKSYGYNTAITGSKLIDLPALRSSDVGITTSSSNIVKKLSDIVLTTIDFSKLLEVLEDSKRVIETIKKIIIYVASCSVAILTFIMFSSLWKYELSLIVQETFWFNNIIMLLSSLALICEYKYEGTFYLNSIIDKNTIKERAAFIIFNGTLMGVLAFGIFIFTKDISIEFAQISSFTVLNLNAIFFNYSFSRKLFFRNKLSNLIMLINLAIQFGSLMLMGSMKTFENLTYWRNIGVITGVWLLVSLFHKFNKDEYYD